jgi:hypothetical protein
MDPEPEVLGDDRVPLLRDRPRTHLRPGWLVALLVVVALVGSAVYVDGRERSREGEAMRACEAQLRRASDHADFSLGLTTSYVQSPRIQGGGIHLADLMAPLARRVLPAVERADRTCEAVRIRPWHFSLVQRHQADTAYASALVTLLELISAQGDGTFHGDPTLQRLRDAAGLSGG